MNVEVVFTAWNRLAYTQASFALLKRNTDWDRVDRLVVYDDGSEDGTREYLEQAGAEVPVPGFILRDGGWRSLGATMNDAASLCESEAMVKIDNDIAMPPGWLERLIDTAERHPQISLLGMEAGWTGAYQGVLAPRKYGVTPATHIGGVGLMRLRAFEMHRPLPLSLGKNGRAGFTIWQHRYHLSAGWITPDLPVVQFDRIPIEPWSSLAGRYVANGWARKWEPYTDDMHPWWDWIPRVVVRDALRASKRVTA